MPRTEEILMTGWEFGLMKCGPYSVAEAAKKLKVQGAVSYTHLTLPTTPYV